MCVEFLLGSRKINKYSNKNEGDAKVPGQRKTSIVVAATAPIYRYGAVCCLQHNRPTLSVWCATRPYADPNTLECCELLPSIDAAARICIKHTSLCRASHLVGLLPPMDGPLFMCGILHALQKYGHSKLKKAVCVSHVISQNMTLGLLHTAGSAAL